MATLPTDNPRILADLVVHLCEIDTWNELGHTTSISVDKVLAWSWKPYRLEDCAQRLAAGERAPALSMLMQPTRIVCNIKLLIALNN